MKTTRQSALALPLMMLLFVLGAAFVFLYQEQQELEAALTDSEAEAAALDETREALNANLVAEQTLLNSTEATRIIAEIALATTQAENMLLNGNVVESDQARATLTSENALLNAANGALQATREALLQQPPQVAILAPTGDEPFLAEEEVRIEIAAADPAGVTALTVQINQTVLRNAPITAGTLISHTETWSPPAAGPYLIEVIATNSNGVTSVPVQVQINVDEVPAALLTVPELLASADDPRWDEIGAEVQALRQITVTTDPRIETTADLATQIGTALLPPARVTELEYLLRGMGLLDEDDELAPLLAAALTTEQIAYYFPDSETLFISEDAVEGIDRDRAFAGAYLRYLQDQQFGLALDAVGPFSDQSMAAWGVMLGERSYILNRFDDAFLQLTPVESSARAPEILFPADIPEALAAYLSFPSVVGEEFVAVLMGEEEDTAVLDSVWDTPPISSEQLLHLEKYADYELPDPVNLRDLPADVADSYTEMARGVLGEWGLRQLLAAPGAETRQQLPPVQVNLMAAGWGGDEYAVFADSESGALLFLLEISWDTVKDGDDFALDFPNYANSVLPDGAVIALNAAADCREAEIVICLRAEQGRSLLIRAPDAATAERILEMYDEE